MTIEELENRMEEYLPFEEALRNYYQENGTYMEEKDIPENLVELPFAVPHNDLKSIAGTGKEIQRLLNYDAMRTIRENIHFIPGYDIFLQKHARYLKTQPHDHDFFELCYQYRGSCGQIILNENGEEHLTLSEGGFLLIPPGQKHIASADGNCLMINIGVRASTFTETFSGIIPEESVLGSFFSNLLTSGKNSLSYLYFPTDERIRAKLQGLMLIYISEGIYTSGILNVQLSLILLMLLELHGQECRSGQLKGGHRQLPAVLRYMEENMTDTIQETARHFGYSPDHLNRIFRENLGKSMREVRLDISMKKAAAFLKDTDIPVSAISEYLGYADTTSLIRMFKTKYGITPAQYRRKIRLPQE